VAAVSKALNVEMGSALSGCKLLVFIYDMYFYRVSCEKEKEKGEMVLFVCWTRRCNAEGEVVFVEPPNRWR
jgi:hypothetical protein